jgi:hypothetical protein
MADRAQIKNESPYLEQEHIESLSDIEGNGIMIDPNESQKDLQMVK